MSIRIRMWITFVFVLALSAGAFFVDFPKYLPWTVPYLESVSTHLGLDLQGGTSLLYEADMSGIPAGEESEATDGVRDVIDRRINALGVAEPVIQTSTTGGSYRIIVDLPGVTDVGEAVARIGETPILEFKKEGGEPTQIEIEGLDEPIEIPGYEDTGLTGQQLKRASVIFDQQTSLPQVSIEFNDEGADLFAQLTEESVGKTIAIYLDGEVISAPVVNTPITNGQAVISGSFSLDEAKELSRRLNAGALPVPIELVSQQNVGPSLGQESLGQSIVAGAFGLMLVALFMIMYYRLPGLMAVVALGAYTLMVFAIFRMVPVTLTLAGVAGFILSIGMAVDANVLIFERMREEIRNGKSIRSSIDDGFKRAWLPIRDSNISSLITTLILYWFGTSIIRGFALTLAIGIIISMFSAITITRTLLRLSALKKRKWFYAV